MKKKTLGVGIIGGGFNARFHIRSWVGVRNADIIGIFDPDRKRAEEAAGIARKLEVGEAKAYKSITDLVSDPKIDALWISAPNFTRIDVMEEIVHALEGLEPSGPISGAVQGERRDRRRGRADALLQTLQCRIAIRRVEVWR